MDLIHLDNDGFDPVMRASDLKGFRDSIPCDPQTIAYRDRLDKADHLINDISHLVGTNARHDQGLY